MYHRYCSTRLRAALQTLDTRRGGSSRRCRSAHTLRILPVALAVVLSATETFSATFDPSAADYAGRRGMTIHVSKLGDNSDGKTWKTAFRTIQSGLLAVPDAEGGHRVVVRPDTYLEANLYPSQKGAPGSYNLLVGDVDGSLGSGATGWVVVDSGCPDIVVRTDPKGGGGNPGFVVLDSGGPEKGLKSIDWWGPWKCTPDFSGVVWDRWIFRNIYATGSEGGIGWDMTCQAGTEFSAIVEDCVGIGRFAGAAVMAHVNRADEPVVFRRSYFLDLDWWGDAGAAYVRAHNAAPRSSYDAVFEDCTLVGPDNALQAGNPGFDGYTRVKFVGCRLLVLNFSQPHGTPSSGVVNSKVKGEYLHVDFEDCVLAGFKVFGSGDDRPIPYTLKGRVSAYVQFTQKVPEGMEPLGLWPLDAFQRMAPPLPGKMGTIAPPSSATPRLVKLPLALGQHMENAPFVFGGKELLALNYRDDTKNKTDGYKASMYLFIRDQRTGDTVTRFGEGHSFVSAFVHGEELSVFASEGTNHDWFQSIYRFSSEDLKTWKRELAIPQEGSEHLFNVSVCRDEQGFLMAYESNEPVMFCFKFARSDDLVRWKKLEGLIFTGVSNEYSACPMIRYVPPYYYVIYAHAAVPGHPGWISFLARSRDLETWELSPLNPILEAASGEGCNNSDVDLIEVEGRTYLYYATGDQQTWGALRVAMFPGTMKEFFDSCFPEGMPTVKATAKRK